MRQDRLLFGALIGSLEQTIVPLVCLTTTSKELWDTLAKTYASASRGHIKQLQARFKSITKGPQTVTKFMHSIKACTDQLALLGYPIKHEDVIDKVLEGLDPAYQGIIDAVNARDTSISFAELHEKLINRELTLKAQPLITGFPASAHATTTSRSNIRNHPPPPSNNYRNYQNSKSPYHSQQNSIQQRPT